MHVPFHIFAAVHAIPVFIFSNLAHTLAKQDLVPGSVFSIEVLTHMGTLRNPEEP